MAKHDSALILDIDSSSVGACVVTGGEVPLISTLTRVPIGNGSTSDPNALVLQLKEALPLVLKQYSALERVAVIVASPWFLARVQKTDSKTERPESVTKSKVQAVLAAIPPLQEKAEVLERIPVSVTVNGYRTLLKKSVVGNAVSVVSYESHADTAFVEAVTAAVKAQLPRATLSFHTTPIAYADTLLRISDEEHATVLDVGGEVTDVVILSHQTIVYVASIPHGFMSIARAINAENVPDTLSRLSMLARNELAVPEREALLKKLIDAGGAWQKSFVSILAEAGNTIPVPHRVFLVGEHEEFAWFQLVVEAASTRQRPLVRVADPDLFSRLIRFGEGGAFDASLVLDALFFHTRLNGAQHIFAVPPMIYSVK